MKKVDFESFLGKTVTVQTYRRHRLKKFSGKLVHVGRAEICLEANDGTLKWMAKPNRYNDSIEAI